MSDELMELNEIDKIERQRKRALATALDQSLNEKGKIFAQKVNMGFLKSDTGIHKLVPSYTTVQSLDEIASKIRKIEDTQILVSPILCPNHPKKPSDKDLKYEVTIFDIYGSDDNLKNYYNNKTRQLEISLILEGNINSEQKDKLNIELIELNSKIIEFEELEKKIV